MFDRNKGGAHVGQQNLMGAPCGPVSDPWARPGRRTMLGSDATVATAPYAPTTIPILGGTPVNTIGSSAAGTAFMLTFTPKSPVKAVALFMDPDNAVNTELCGLFVGAQGAQNLENLFAQNGGSSANGIGYIPASAFEDLNACVPLLEAGPANFMCPFILVGRTTSGTNATTSTLRASLVVDYTG